jgi:SnoaL-like domain
VLTLQDLSDRAEITDVLVREASAMDRRDWESWEAQFTPDAFIDYTANDGARGNPAEVRAWLAAVLGRFTACQHLSSNHEISLYGDRATVRSMQYIGVRTESPEGPRVLFSGIWFRDELRRTDAGWRIGSRIEELAWRHNFPQDFRPPEA